MKKHDRRRIERFFVLCGLLLALGWAGQSHLKSEAALRLVENGYRRAFSQLTGDLGELDATMQKLLSSTSPELTTSLCLNIFGKTGSAQTALSELPFADYGLETVSAYLSRLGDYARSLAGQPAEERAPESETLRALADTASILAQNLLEMEQALERGELRLSAQSGSGGEVPLAGEEFSRMEQDFPELPTLVYDGPFSQHLGAEEPAQLMGLPEVSEEEARRAAADFTAVPTETLTDCLYAEGKLPLYIFSDGNGLSVQVTRQGGKVLSLRRRGAEGSGTLTDEEALASALAFLTERGFDHMAESYWTRYEHEILFNFAATQGDWLCYPDLVKVSVSTADGAILGFEGAGWLNHHRERELTAPAVTAEEARAALAPGLTELSHRLCVIPSPGEHELPCHEFTCEDARGEHILVYVNAENGRQEDILCLLEDENGTLAR